MKNDTGLIYLGIIFGFSLVSCGLTLMFGIGAPITLAGILVLAFTIVASE